MLARNRLALTGRSTLAALAAFAALSLAGCPHLLSGDGSGGRDAGLADLASGNLPQGDLAGAAADLAGAAVGDLSPRDLASGDLPHPSDLTAPSDLTMGGALDPGLALPDPSGMPCTMPGSLTECPGVEVCRFYTASEGRCESCTTCNNLGAFCTASSDCDILFMCYKNKCTNFCQLGTSECGPPANCLNIGAPTYGVCK
jgi:hypothetical protein